MRAFAREAVKVGPNSPQSPLRTSRAVGSNVPLVRFVWVFKLYFLIWNVKFVQAPLSCVYFRWDDVIINIITNVAFNYISGKDHLFKKKIVFPGGH